MLNNRLLRVNQPIFRSDGFDHNLIVLGEGFDPRLELFFSEGEKQLIQIIHTIFQIWHSDNEAVARGQ